VSLRFLIADDTRFMRKMLTDILKEMDHEVVGEAENGATAVQLYQELRPDAIFMDIYMPEMDGIEAMRQIRSIDEKAIVIVCSGTSQQYLISDAMKAGANGYVIKPFKAKQIKEAIQKYVMPNLPLFSRETAVDASSGSEASGQDASSAVEPAVQPEPEMHISLAPAPQEEAADGLAADGSASGGLESVEPAAAEPVSAKLAPFGLADGDDGPGVVKEEKPVEAEDEPAPQSDPTLEASDEEQAPALSPEEAVSPDEVAGPEASGDDAAAAVSPEPAAPSETPDLLSEIIAPELETAASESEEKREVSSGRDETVIQTVEAIPISGLKDGNADKGESGLKEFRSSISCRWKEDIGDQEVTYVVTCNEGEPYLRIETSAKGDEFVLSFEGLRLLQQWLERNMPQTMAQRMEATRHS